MSLKVTFTEEIRNAKFRFLCSEKEVQPTNVGSQQTEGATITKILTVKEMELLSFWLFVSMAQEIFIIVEAYMEVHIHFQSLVIDIFDTTSFSPQAIIRGGFRTQPNICDGGFLWKQLAVFSREPFSQKNFFVYVWLRFKYSCDIVEWQ